MEETAAHDGNEGSSLPDFIVAELKKHRDSITHWTWPGLASILGMLLIGPWILSECSSHGAVWSALLWTILMSSLILILNLFWGTDEELIAIRAKKTVLTAWTVIGFILATAVIVHLIGPDGPLYSLLSDIFT